MAEKRAAFSLRRRRSLGFSKCRWLRTVFNVPSRSIFFFSRRSALSTGSPFLSFISVKSNHFLPKNLGTQSTLLGAFLNGHAAGYGSSEICQIGKRRAKPFAFTLAANNGMLH